MIKRIQHISIITVLFLGILSCKNDDNSAIADDSLASLIKDNTINVDNVIACASGSANATEIIAYVYPRPGATDIRYYETVSVDDDKNDYQKYSQISIESTDFFNGYLKKFTRTTAEEKWVIITFFENNELHLSNPIRLKHLTKPTEFSNNVMVNSMEEGMPVFTWENGVFEDNKIYFQIISDISNELLSGTYTFEKQFQYYKLDNVVLNITQEPPPELDAMNQYDFTLMGVSEDNWVNLFIEKSFTP
ncbi:hypothetical protein [Aquimarina algiphila]|uniref:hypothetical protein n=1 Tax=Aquimarina algiphila TaxID=2047982 RepID=UPI00232BF0F9|nr:hypothetical protein [Aquimarina algiphila]